MKPEFEDESPIDPFNLWEGANFKLKIRKVDGYQNYDKSEFEAASALLDDDSELERVYNQEYSLLEFLDPKNFKSNEELKKRLDKVLGIETKQVQQTPASRPSRFAEPTVDTNVDDEEDEDLKFLRGLAEDDD